MVLQVLRDAGASDIKNTDFSTLDNFNKMNSTQKICLMAASLQQQTKGYLASLTSNPHNLPTVNDILEVTGEIPKKGFPIRGVEHFELVVSIHANRSDFLDAKKSSERSPVKEES